MIIIIINNHHHHHHPAIPFATMRLWWSQNLHLGWASNQVLPQQCLPPGLVRTADDIHHLFGLHKRNPKHEWIKGAMSFPRFWEAKIETSKDPPKYRLSSWPFQWNKPPSSWIKAIPTSAISNFIHPKIHSASPHVGLTLGRLEVYQTLHAKSTGNTRVHIEEEKKWGWLGWPQPGGKDKQHTLKTKIWCNSKDIHLAWLLQGTKNHKTYGQNVAREVVESPRLHIPQKRAGVNEYGRTEISHVPWNVAKASHWSEATWLTFTQQALNCLMSNALVPTIFHSEPDLRTPTAADEYVLRDWKKNSQRSVTKVHNSGCTPR